MARRKSNRPTVGFLACFGVGLFLLTQVLPGKIVWEFLTPLLAAFLYELYREHLDH